ncbi:MAG TPA: malectin domain-containing carbohydrate-binding protein [Rugosimonospora sp.]|nr:malectin domain-containing carbohydrate-binding protein [Rugosimonospora sp.]
MKLLLLVVLIAVLLQAQAPVWSTLCGSAGDRGYSTSPATQAIPGPPSVRIGTFIYTIPVPAPGVYNLTLTFLDPYRTAAGQRVFDVTVNGLKVLANFDIFAAAGGQSKSIDKTFPVTATGPIAVAFTPISTNFYAGCSAVPCPALCAAIALTAAQPAGQPGVPPPPADAWFLSGPAVQLPSACPASAPMTFYAVTPPDAAALWYCVPGAKWQRIAMVAILPLVGSLRKDSACSGQGTTWRLSTDGKSMISDVSANCILP